MSKVKEFFTYSVYNDNVNWGDVVEKQHCRYIHKKCFKVRKSESDISIGTCTVEYGKTPNNIIICPHRLLERGQIFTDCLHLLNSHTVGNELHLVPEVGIPGGNVDYFLVSTDKHRKVKDFVGIELQTMDTTGTVWPERQRLMEELELSEGESISDKTYGMNWKMTAKTILVQLHHKIDTFEHLNKHFVLIVQDCLLDYIQREFSFDHISKEALIGDSMHFHAYSLEKNNDDYKLVLRNRCSTNSNGISKLLGLNADANMDFEQIAKILEAKISDDTIFSIA